jgi:hypothetical protein
MNLARGEITNFGSIPRTEITQKQVVKTIRMQCKELYLIYSKTFEPSSDY